MPASPYPHAPLFDGPLYVRGARRPGPSRWGYDPTDASLLIVPWLAPKRPDPILAARAFWQDRETWDRRADLVPELRLRRIGRDSKRAGTHHQVVTLVEDRTPRGDWRALAQKFCQLLAEHASLDADHPIVGAWTPAGKFKGFLSRHQWAKRLGVTPKRWDFLISCAKAGGLIKRRQRRDKDPQTGVYSGRVASLLVTDLFWVIAGVWGLVLRHRAWLDKQARKAERKANPRRSNAPGIGRYAAGMGDRGQAQAAELLAQMGATRRGWPPPDDPPDGD